MIIKLVCGKEIHVYDLKAQETLDDLVGKIRDLFKKLPEQFVLVYRPVEEEEVRLKTNQELYKLIDSVKNEVKMLKLFIEKSGQSPLAQTKSEQRLETQAIESFDDMTQKIECLEQQIDPKSQLQPRSSPSNSQIKSLCEQDPSQSIKSPTEVTNEAENIDSEFKQVGKSLSEILQTSEREINVNDGESSDPKDLRNSPHESYNTDKENLINLGLADKPLRSHKIPEENPMLQKPSFKEQVEEPIADELIQDDFLSHNARCDICNTFPICGSRFKCVVCQTYDLCQICEQKHGHDHPMLKIRFSFQTPIRINVDIPQYRQRPSPEIKPAPQMINLQQLSPKDRRDRVLIVSSEISELLSKDIQECMNFVGRNEQYTKEMLIQALIENKEPSELIKVEEVKEKQGGLKGILNNFKGYLFGSE